MQIWTTPQLNDQFLERALPVRLLPDRELKDRFLIDSAAGDAAVLNLDADYAAFLDTAKEQGIAGPVIFISSEPTIVREDLYRSNAVILDVKTMGALRVKNLVRFVLNLAARQNRSGPAETEPLQVVARIEEDVLEDPAAIRTMLQSLVKHAVPVIVAFELREAGEPVTARGVCNIRELRGEVVVFHRFRQSLMLRGLKKGVPVKAYFSYRQRNLESVVTIREATDQEVAASLPERLYSAKGMRIQPSAAKPVQLYAFIPNEPTTALNVVDLCAQGIGFLCARDLPIGGDYKLTIMLPDPRSVVLARGVIRYKKDLGSVFRYGAEIRSHPWDEENIAKYVMRREAEIIGLLRNT